MSFRNTVTFSNGTKLPQIGFGTMLAKDKSETAVEIAIRNVIGRPKLTDDPVVQAVANKLGVTTAQVLLAWGVYRGNSVISGSVNEDRMIVNFKQIDLSQEDYQKISSIGHNNHIRLQIPRRYPPMWDINVFDEPEEKAATFKVNMK